MVCSDCKHYPKSGYCIVCYCRVSDRFAVCAFYERKLDEGKMACQSSGYDIWESERTVDMPGLREKL